MKKLSIIIFAILCSVVTFGSIVYSTQNDSNIFFEIDEYFDPISEYDANCVKEYESKYGRDVMIKECRSIFENFCYKPIEKFFIYKGNERLKNKCFAKEIKDLVNEVNEEINK